MKKTSIQDLIFNQLLITQVDVDESDHEGEE